MVQNAADNDILFKGAWYGLLRELVAAIPSAPGDTLILGHARFVVGKRLQRQRDRGDVEAGKALDHFGDVLHELVQAEPTDAEIALAASLESSAQMDGLALDSGESLLCSMVLHRQLRKLATGDKRAIRALEILSCQREDLRALSGKVVCLEQLFLRLLAGRSPADIRAAVCGRPHVDKALTACFGCSANGIAVEDWAVGLKSYVNSLRADASTVLET
jgi:hypothetical protein